MKLLTTAFLLFTFSITAQDTLQLGQRFLDKFDQTEGSIELSEVQELATMGDSLYLLKNRKTPLSLMMAMTYYKMATEYKKEDPGNTPYKFKGHLPPEQQQNALRKARRYFEFYVQNSEVKDDTYRNAQTGLNAIDELLAEFE